MKRILTMSAIVIIIFFSYLFIPSTTVNYDLSKYLPSDSLTSEGIKVLEESFGLESSIQILVEDVSVSDLLIYKSSLSTLDHVSSVIWLDNYVDISTTPLEYIPSDTLDMFYIDGNTLLTITFDFDSYSTQIDDLTKQIETIFDSETIHMRGEVLVNQSSRNIAHQEMIKILFVIVPIIILLLFLSSISWFEPLIILITLAFAVALNLITNGLLSNVSYITQTMCMALQLALSIDYSIFMIHRYYEERETKEKDEAIQSAFRRSFRPISISALTTIAGFSALAFMNFLIGKDIAIVLSKGILFSFITTMIVLPILLYWFDDIIHKMKHKIVFPKLDWLTKIQIKGRYLFVGVFLLLLGFGLYAQTQTEYLYGASSVGEEETTVAKDTLYINRIFGENNPIVLLIPTVSLNIEASLINQLEMNPHVTEVQGLALMVDPNTPIEFLPSTLTATFVQNGYSRIIINTDISAENEETYAFSSQLKEILSQNYDEYYIVGNATSISDMRDSILSQGSLIMGLTILFVGLIVGIIFKSWKIPFILLSVITSAIFLSLGYLAISGSKVLYIGYIIVMSIQLGATIDYAVLLSNRYLEERRSKNKVDALTIAFQKSSMSIFVSGTILTIVGFVEGLYSNLSSITSIGFMLGRGTLISLIMILTILPPILYLLDPWIIKHQKHLE